MQLSRPTSILTCASGAVHVLIAASTARVLAPTARNAPPSTDCVGVPPCWTATALPTARQGRIPPWLTVTTLRLAFTLVYVHAAQGMQSVSSSLAVSLPYLPRHARYALRKSGCAGVRPRCTGDAVGFLIAASIAHILAQTARYALRLTVCIGVPPRCTWNAVGFLIAASDAHILAQTARNTRRRTRRFSVNPRYTGAAAGPAQFLARGAGPRSFIILTAPCQHAR